tara:strand:- start:1463 stop:1858 length:396 start_codon:yes stop_codon:yes gene_type:complete
MIERITSNYRRIKAFAPEWDMKISDKIYYLMVTDKGRDVGAMAFHTCDEPGLLMHVQLGHNCRGARAAAAYKSAFKWMFENTKHETLLGRIPATVRHARVMARHVGASFMGVDCDGLMCYRVTKNDSEGLT